MTSDQIVSSPRDRKFYLDDSFSLLELEQTATILDSLDSNAAILDWNHHIVYANSGFTNTFGPGGMKELLGMKPGNALDCSGTDQSKRCCGNGTNCNFCGLFAVINEAKTHGKSATGEIAMTLNNIEKDHCKNFSIKVSPIEIRERNFLVLTLKDISSETRRKMMERIFFHDVINSAGGLKGLLTLMEKSSNTKELEEYLGHAQDVAATLLDEIRSQKDLANAETGDLLVTPSSTDTHELIQLTVKSMEHHNTSHKKTIRVKPGDKAIALVMDKSLLLRVLINMVKNALEAISAGDEITIRCNQTEAGMVRFSVWNPGTIAAHIVPHIFRRSFSTKAPSRGLGTYSIKLLTERYLKGKAWFETGNAGTFFHVEVPAFLA